MTIFQMFEPSPKGFYFHAIEANGLSIVLKEVKSEEECKMSMKTLATLQKQHGRLNLRPLMKMADFVERNPNIWSLWTALWDAQRKIDSYWKAAALVATAARQATAATQAGTPMSIRKTLDIMLDLERKMQMSLDETMVKKFLDEKTASSREASILKGDLYAAYREWCALSGIYPCNLNWFMRRVHSFRTVFEERKVAEGKQVRLLKGLVLL